MTTPQIIPRRKPATYGKPRRNPPSHYLSLSALDSYRPSSGGLALQSSVAAPRAKGSDSQIPSGRHRSPSPQPNFSSDSPSLVASRTPAGHLRREVLTEDGPNSRFPSASTKSDMSSSAEAEIDVGFDQASMRKKRKVPTPSPTTRWRRHASIADDKLSPATSTSIDFIGSTQSSQGSPRIAYATSIIPALSSRKLLGPNASPSSSSKRSQAVYRKQTPDSSETCSVQVGHPAPLKTLSGGAEPQVLHHHHGAIVGSPTPNGIYVSKGGVEGTCTRSSSASEHTRRSTSPAPRTPTHEKHVVKVTTAHQRELWSMLLPEIDQTSNPRPRCPGHRGLPDLGSGERSCNTPGSPSTESARSCAPVTGATKTALRRQRLIDKFQSAVPMAQSCMSESSGHAGFSGSDGEDRLTVEEVSSSAARARRGSRHIGRSAPPDILDTVPRSQPNGHEPLPSCGRPKATYSSQRSYLANGGLEEAALFDMPLVDDSHKRAGKVPSRHTRTETLSLWVGLNEDATEGGFEDSQGSSMRTIHELLKSGENVRDLNETEAIFDDIEGQGLTSMDLKRRRLLNLVHRLQEPAFCRLLLDQGLDHRLLSQSASKDNDAITDALLAVAVLYLVAAALGRQAASQQYDRRVADFFASKLDRDQNLIDLIRSRRCNISRQDQADLKSFFSKTLLHSSLWRSGAPAKLSSRLIALQGLDHLIRKRREAACRSEILAPTIVQRLAEGLPSLEAMATPSADLLLETQLAMSILESHTISGVSLDDQQWTEKTLGPITSVLPWLTCIPQQESEDTQKLTLRLYLNLTNNNARLCEAFAKRAVVQDMLRVVQSHYHVVSDPRNGFGDTSVLDTLILALGALINLVEWSSKVRCIMTSNEEDDECFVKVLVGLFVARREVVAEVKWL